MNRPLILTIVILLLPCFAVAAEDTSKEKGSISGIINYCNKGGVAGMQVFVPGKPYVVITGTDGRFVLNNVPIGDYSLNFMLRGKILYFNKWAEVSANKTTSLDLISICDAENAATLDDRTAGAPATPKLTAPTAAKPLILNNIDCSIIKEGVLFLLNNGKGKCADGKVVVKQCDTGYANCDENTSNGCEVDTNNDAQHCGECFNECSQLDSCNIGMC